MKVERLAVFNFKVTLTEREFALIRILAETFDGTVEDVIRVLLLTGSIKEKSDLKRK